MTIFRIYATHATSVSCIMSKLMCNTRFQNCLITLQLLSQINRTSSMGIMEPITRSSMLINQNNSLKKMHFFRGKI